MKTTLVKRALPETAASVHMSVDLIKFTTKKDLLRSRSKFLFISIIDCLSDSGTHHFADITDGVTLLSVQPVFFYGKQFLAEFEHFSLRSKEAMSITTRSPSPFLVR